MTPELQGGRSYLTNKRSESEGYAGITNLQCMKTAPKHEIPLILMEMGK